MIENDNKTIWCGNLTDAITEELLYELFLQAGPLEKVKVVRDRSGRNKNSFAFITYVHDVSVPYAMKVLRGTTLFNRTLTMQCRGRMALLPPPIRCNGPEPNIDFSNQPYVVKQFANMTENLREKEQISDVPRQRETDDRLAIASLQGNWQHRHHPYRGKDLTQNRDNYRPRDRDFYRNRDKPSGNWRDNRHYNKKPYYNRQK